MASFQIRQRDPLLDQNTQAMLERRGRELIGLGLVIAALLFTLMLWSYSPEDPGWMVATQEPARNLLGRFGAAISSTLVILIGRGAWSIPLILAVWGLRFMLHRGAERVLGRIVFAVIAVALAAAYCSTLVAPVDWAHTFGLGGLFGDTVAGALIGVLPGSAGFGLKLLSLVAFFTLIAMMLYVTGFDRSELRFVRQVLIYGSIMAYSAVMQALGKGASGALSGAKGHGRALAERRRVAREEASLQAAAQAAAQAEMQANMRLAAPGFAPQGFAPPNYAQPGYAPQPQAQPQADAGSFAPQSMPQNGMPGRPSVVRRPQAAMPADEAPVFATAPLGAEPAWNAPATLRAEPRHFEPQAELPKEKMGFLARMRNVVKPDAEWVEPAQPSGTDADYQPSEDRIKARIADVISSRARSGAGGAPAAHAGMTPLQVAIAARRSEPPVMRPRGPMPLVADTRPGTQPPRSANIWPEPVQEDSAFAGAALQTAAPLQEPEIFFDPAEDYTAATPYSRPAMQPMVEAATPVEYLPHHLPQQQPQAEAPYAAQSLAAPTIAAPTLQAELSFRGESNHWADAPADHAANQWPSEPVWRQDDSWHPAPEAAWPSDGGSHASPDAAWAADPGYDWQPGDNFEPDYDPTPIGLTAAAPEQYERPAAPVMAAHTAPPIPSLSAIAAPSGMPSLGPAPTRNAPAPSVAVPMPMPVSAAPLSAASMPMLPPVAPQAPQPVQLAQAAERHREPAPRPRFDDRAVSSYELPPLSLLASAETVERNQLSDEALEENARMLESVLDDYGVKGEIVAVRPGPVVTMYELEPAPGLKASRVIGLADDIARSMSALSARVSTVPGRTVIGIELPNAHREKVVLREILSARDFGDSQMRLPLALGKDIGGEAVVANLAKMPHLLIAGTTGSGKSVAINTMILSLLYKLTPEECRLIMIDPKMLELSVYDGIPHLLSPVVTDPKKAVIALKWVVGEMEERYRKMSKMGVRNIEGYNARVREAVSKGEMFKRTIQTGFDDETGDPVFETEEFAPEPFPYIVVVVDEMADLMMVAGKEIEACIQRLAQMARASGIHLIMATQRPSVDVITGTIKANFPTRISFQVTSKIDSRTILGEMGAEQLLGQGDMLYMGSGGRSSRIHGPFVSDEEVEEIVNHLKSFGPPTYMSGVVEGPDEDAASEIDQVLGLGGGDGTEDALYDQAVAIVAKDRKCSTSYIQRKLGIGYNKAARLVEQMEENHVVTSANHVGKREILIPEV